MFQMFGAEAHGGINDRVKAHFTGLVEGRPRQENRSIDAIESLTVGVVRFGSLRPVLLRQSSAAFLTALYCAVYIPAIWHIPPPSIPPPASPTDTLHFLLCLLFPSAPPAPPLSTSAQSTATTVTVSSSLFASVVALPAFSAGGTAGVVRRSAAFVLPLAGDAAGISAICCQSILGAF